MRILFYSLHVGMFIGILLAMASFVVSYSSAQAVSSAALQTSTVIRTFEERACLIAHRGKIVTITLKGYIFFGSAVKILEDVKSHVTISVPDLSPQQLMQQQQEKATAATQKAAASAAAKINAEHPPTESTSLLQRNSGDYDPRYGAQAGQFSADSLRNEGRKMSFRLGSKSRSPEPSPGKKPNVADSAVKKLFPDVSAPATGSVGESDSEFSPAALLGQPHSASMLIRTTSSAAAATHSGSYAASVSVYDMSPETLQRVIEERQLERGAESYGVFSSAREVCYGGAQQGSGPLAAPAHGVSRISQPLTIAHQHSGSNLRDLSFLPVTTATSAARAAPDASGVATEPAVDIEMGRPRAGSQGRSLLTEKLEELDASPRAAPTGNNANVNVDPLSAEIMQHEQLQQQDQAPAKKEGPRQQMPLRRQSGQTKVPASATATLAASFENAGLVDSMHSSRQSSIGSLRRGSSSEVNSSEQFPRKPSPGVAEESLLSVVFDHQRRRRAGSGEASRRILLSPSQHPHQQQRNRGAQRDVPTPYQVANALASLQGETIEGILRSRENSVDMTHSDREMPEMKRERSVHDIQPASCSRMTGLDKMHSPSVPCPEQVLSHIPSVQKLTQEMNRAAAGARDWADSAEENGDVMTEYLVSMGCMCILCCSQLLAFEPFLAASYNLCVCAPLQVLDFAAVVGVDATATRSCFLMMVQLMRSANVTVVFANMSASLEALFRVHKVIGVQDVVIPLLDDALEWCEERVLLR